MGSHTRNGALCRGILLAGLIALAGVAHDAGAGIAAGYQTFFIPGSEQQLWDILVDLDDYDPNTPDEKLDPTAGMHAVISVTAASDGTTIYYDHWEDGYEFDPQDPAGTADEIVTLDEGEVQYFESGNVPISPRGTSLHYDGGDVIYVAGGIVTVSRASWTESSGASTLYAIAWEIYPAHAYETAYRLPVGEDLFDPPTGYKDFHKTYVVVQAAEDGTTVEIDDPRTPGVELSATIDAGETTQYYHFGQGTSVTSSEPVQVHVIVGRNYEESGESPRHYEVRGFSIVPEAVWDNVYYLPVGSFPPGNDSEDSDAFFYNPGSSTLSIDWQDRTGTGTFTIASGQTVSYSDGTGHVIPTNSAAIVRGNAVFWGISTVDTESTTYDWGYSLIPERQLRTDQAIGWAPSTLDRTAQGSPLFVTASRDDTDVFIDYSPTDGVFDDRFTIDRLEMLEIYDPDFDLTGSRILATRPIAIVWGEDPETAGAAYNYLDLGYTTLPLPNDWLDLVLLVGKRVDPVVISTDPGQVATFSFEIGAGAYDVDAVSAEDVLPDGWTYRTNSTTIELPDGTTLNAPASEPAINGQTLSWSSSLLGDLAPGERIRFSFEARTTGTFSVGDITWNHVEATGTRTIGSHTQTFTTHDNAYNRFSDLSIDKSSDVANPPLEPSGIVTYTIRVRNARAAAGDMTDVTVSDELPGELSYVAGTVAAYRDAPYSYDTFETLSYANDDGPLAWASDWWERGDDGAPDAGNVRIADDQGQGRLRFDGDGVGVSRKVDTSDTNLFPTITLAFRYRRDQFSDTDKLKIRAKRSSDSSWTLIDRIRGEGSDADYVSYSVDLTAYRDSEMGIRFNSRVATGAIYLDDVQVSGAGGQKTVTVPASAPEQIITAADGVDLFPGCTLTVTFDARLTNSVPADLATVVNRAWTTSTEHPDPLYADDTIPLRLTLAKIARFGAVVRNGILRVRWTTAAEDRTAGFFLYRVDPETGEDLAVHEGILPSHGNAAGGSYEVPDPGADPGGTHAYRLVELESGGGLREYGPFRVSATAPGEGFIEWQEKYFDPVEMARSTIGGPDADPDRDGRTNWQEYVAGTDPRDRASALRLHRIERLEGGGVRISWRSRAGRVYFVERSVGVNPVFEEIAPFVTATPPVNRWEDSLPPAGILRYRVGVEPPEE